MLVAALSTDALVAGFAYGTNRMKIPASSAAVISAVCSIILGLSLAVGSVIRPLLPDRLIAYICFFLLFILGFIKLFDSYIKSLIRKNRGISRQINFSVSQVRFILSVYADPEHADSDLSRTLSPKEAASLALALSLDGLAVGIGAGLGAFPLPLVVLLSVAASLAAVMLGSFLGNRVAEKFELDISWLSGAILIMLALLRLPT